MPRVAKHYINCSNALRLCDKDYLVIKDLDDYNTFYSLLRLAYSNCGTFMSDALQDNKFQAYAISYHRLGMYFVISGHCIPLECITNFLYNYVR